MPVIGSEPPGPASGRLPLQYVAAGCASLLGLLVYVNAIQNPYVYDDFRLIVENRSLMRPMDVRTVLVWDVTRPLVNLSYAIDTLVWGRTRFGYHLTSVLLHALNVWLVFWLAFWALVDRGPRGPGAPSRDSLLVGAFCAAAVFAVHPLMTEAVGYISGRSEVLYSAFFLTAFLAGRRWMIGGGVRWWAACVGLWSAGMLSKESAAMLPAVLFAYERLVLTGSPDERRRRWRWLLLPMLAVAVSLGSVRIALLKLIEYPDLPGVDWRFALLQVDVFWRYLGLFLVPRGQSIFHAVPMLDSPLDPRAMAVLAGLAAFLAVVWVLRRRQELIAFGLLWFPIVFVPSAALFALGRGEAMAEHRAYLPAVGLFLLWGYGVGAMWVRPGVLRLAAAGTAVTFVVTLGSLTVVRNTVWQDPVALTGEAVRMAPGWWVPRVLAGDAFRQSERCAEAVVEYRLAIEMRPLEEVPYTSLARCLMFERRFDEAAQVLLLLRAFNPESQEASMGLGFVAVLSGRFDDARGYFHETLMRNPPRPRARLFLAFLDGNLPAEEYRRVCNDLRTMSNGAPAIEACRIEADHDGESRVPPR